MFHAVQAVLKAGSSYVVNNTCVHLLDSKGNMPEERMYRWNLSGQMSTWPDIGISAS